LTEDGLDLWGVVPIEKDSSSTKFSYKLKPDDLDSVQPDDPFIVAMATCHSLTIIDNELTGDPLDLKVILLQLQYYEHCFTIVDYS
jgi:cation-transporting ATPase 13A3/4/5